MDTLRSGGFALPTLLLVTTILLILAAAIGYSSLSSLMVSNQEHEANQAVYAAEAGLVAAVEELLTSGRLEQPFKGTIANDLGYTVTLFENSGTESMVVAQNVEIPPGTTYLYSEGGLENGKQRQAGLLLKTGLGVYQVGVLGDQFVLRDTLFDTFSSDSENFPEQGHGESLVAASNRNQGDVFTLLESEVEGTLMVGTGGDPNTQISVDAGSSVARKGVLPNLLELDDIQIPETENPNSSEDPFEQYADSPPPTVSLGRMSLSVDGNGIHMLSDGLNFEIQSNGDFELRHDPGGALQVVTGNYFLKQAEAQMGRGEFTFLSPNGFRFVGQDAGRVLTYTPNDGNITYDDDGLANATTMQAPDWMQNLGSNLPPSVTNPVELAPGRYAKVTVDSGTTQLVTEGAYVIDELDVSNGGQLRLGADQKDVDIYVKRKLRVEGEDAVLNATRKAPNLNIFYSGEEAVELNGGSQAYLTLFAPEADVNLTGVNGNRTEFHGALAGRNITVSNADFHYDIATLGIGKGITRHYFVPLARHRF